MIPMKTMKQKMWHKIIDIWDDIVYYIYDKPINIYKQIRCWVKICLLNKYYWKQLRFQMFNCYPWDFTYFYELQLNWLNYAISYFEKQCDHLTEESINFKLKYMKLAKRMLEIYLEKEPLYKYEFDTNAASDCIHSKYKHICIPFVNIKNKHRFKYLVGNDGNTQFVDTMYDKYPEELYKNKALYLYTQIIKKYSSSWWD